MKGLRGCMLVLLLAGCSADFVPFAGGPLPGRVTELPSDWDDVRDTSVISLETNPAEPYSVKLWVIAMDGNLYVHAGANRATWVEHIEADPAVRLQAGDSVFELEARRVTEQAEFDALAVIYEEKYGNRPRNPRVDEAYLFRLVPRA